jgi:hypothetical protein
MSETTSFLGGAAFAGLAALVLLKGGVTVGAPNVSNPQSLPVPTVSPSVVAQPVASPSPDLANGASIEEVDKLKTLVDQQKTDIEKLRTQVQDQRVAIDTLTTQLKTSSVTNAASSAQVLAEDQISNPLLTGLLWAIGGVVLALGGGLALVGMFVLVARQQNSRSPNTVEVIHTAHQIPNYLPSRRRAPVLPARRVVAKRANPPEYD